MWDVGGGMMGVVVVMVVRGRLYEMIVGESVVACKLKAWC